MTAQSARILAAAAGLTAAAPAGLAAALINAAIVRKPPVSDETAGDSDLVAATTAAAQREGRAWMAATPHQRWTVTAHDGTRLAGDYFPAPRPAHRTVILIHGHRADASLMGNFARDYRARGFNVFMADNRAHGDSGGRYVGMGWLDHFDYLRWISRLVRTVGPDARIVLHGLSMGGATALLLGGSPDLPPQVRAVISDCSFSSAYAEFAYHLRARHLPARLILPLASQMCRMLAGYRITQASPLDAIARAAVPVLLIHGGADTYNPTAMAHELHAAQPHADLWIVPGADHVMSYFTDPRAYRNASNSSCAACPRPDARTQPNAACPGSGVSGRYPMSGIPACASTAAALAGPYPRLRLHRGRHLRFFAASSSRASTSVMLIAPDFRAASSSERALPAWLAFAKAA